MVGPEESWRWVEPLPGYALINLGDAMPIFTNDKFESGNHRVVTDYGDQGEIDRYRCSCLDSPPGLAMRPQ
jgi:isopenicillin N synthase-like dioxygenase